MDTNHGVHRVRFRHLFEYLFNVISFKKKVYYCYFVAHVIKLNQWWAKLRYYKFEGARKLLSLPKLAGAPRFTSGVPDSESRNSEVAYMKNIKTS